MSIENYTEARDKLTFREESKEVEENLNEEDDLESDEAQDLSKEEE